MKQLFLLVLVLLLLPAACGSQGNTGGTSAGEKVLEGLYPNHPGECTYHETDWMVMYLCGGTEEDLPISVQQAAEYKELVKSAFEKTSLPYSIGEQNFTFNVSANNNGHILFIVFSPDAPVPNGLPSEYSDFPYFTVNPSDSVAVSFVNLSMDVGHSKFSQKQRLMTELVQGTVFVSQTPGVVMEQMPQEVFANSLVWYSIIPNRETFPVEEYQLEYEDQRLPVMWEQFGEYNIPVY